MKLGFSAWAMAGLPVERQVAIVHEAGYAAIELVSISGGPLDAVGTDAGERRRIRRLVDDSGLALPSIAGHADPLAGDAERRAASLARLRAGVDLAADMAGPDGPPCLVAMAYGKPEEYEQVRGRIAEIFGELARYAASRGVVVALEPHVGQAIDLPEKVVWLLETVDSPSFRLNFDNSHFECMGRHLDDYVPLLAPYSVHTHLKDQEHGRYPDQRFLVPGEGDLDFPRYLAAMAAAGYDGAITIEIAKMIQARSGYDPSEVAGRSFAVLAAAAERAGVTFATGGKVSQVSHRNVDTR